MADIKTIAIIGATGTVGSAIARTLSKNHHHRLLLMSDDQVALADLKLELERSGTDAFAISCERDASWEADIIVIATSPEAGKEVADKIRDVATGKIVISISAMHTAEKRKSVRLRDTSAAERLQRLLPDSKVVKTINATFTPDSVALDMDDHHSDAFIAGNNDAAVKTVAEILHSAGFNPIIAGNLKVTRTLERRLLLQTEWSASGEQSSGKKKPLNMKDLIKSYFALVAFIALSFWILARYVA